MRLSRACSPCLKWAITSGGTCCVAVSDNAARPRKHVWMESELPQPGPASSDRPELSLVDLAQTDGPDEVVHDSAVLVIAAGGTCATAAATIGVSELAMMRMMAEESFGQRVEQQRSSMLGRTAGVLAHAAIMAAATLTELLDHSMPPTVRLGAARAILASEPIYREGDQIVHRLEELESQLLPSRRSSR